MPLDLLAGTTARPAPRPRPTVLVFDSGLGGLTVLAEIRRARPDARIVYAADDAAFPYGAWSEPDLTARVCQVVGELIGAYAPDLAVIACNTASTLVLPTLRARFAIPFVGTVPAIKPAVAATRTGRVSVLATPGTVARDYTRGLIATYAGSTAVDLVGSVRLAGYAEAELAGQPVPDDRISAEIAPCFRDREGAPTDVVVLACTHYPLLTARFRSLAPWPVTWIDPAPAIARRVVQIVGDPPLASGPGPGSAVFTDGRGLAAPLRSVLAARGLPDVRTGACPIARAA